MPHEAGQCGCEECRRGAAGGSGAGGGRRVLLSRNIPPSSPPTACRARAAHLIKQIVATQDPLHLREFTSYFHGQAKNQPSSLITSHEGDDRNPAVTIFPSLAQQSIKWTPFYEETPPPRAASEKKYACHCSDCASENCTRRRPEAPAAVLKKFLFKDNIMTFCNQETMTPKVNDVSCGICLGVDPIRNSRSVKMTTTKTKDNSSYPRPPRTPILRRPHEDEPWTSRVSRGSDPSRELDFSRRLSVYDEYKNDIWPQAPHGRQGAVRDTDAQQWGEAYGGRYAPGPSGFEYCDYCTDFLATASTQRRILYNEGISDSVANSLPTHCKRKQRPIELYTKPSTTTCSTQGSETVIPYSHRAKSKYHIDCQRQPSLTYRAGREGDCEEIRRLLDSPRPKRRAPPRADCHTFAPCRVSCPPRKMLSSEKNIGGFIFSPNIDMNPEDE